MTTRSLSGPPPCTGSRARRIPGCTTQSRHTCKAVRCGGTHLHGQAVHRCDASIHCHVKQRLQAVLCHLMRLQAADFDNDQRRDISRHKVALHGVGHAGGLLGAHNVLVRHVGAEIEPALTCTALFHLSPCSSEARHSVGEEGEAVCVGCCLAVPRASTRPTTVAGGSLTCHSAGQARPDRLHFKTKKHR